MSAGGAAYSILTAHAGTAALVQKRVYPVAIPQGEKLPAVVFAQIDIKPTHAGGADGTLEGAHLQVTPWAESYAGAHALAIQIRAALKDYKGTADETAIQRIFIKKERDTYDPETKSFGVVQEYMVWHT